MSVLYVAATPIGNLADMSDRLRATLRDCDLIAAEDTRVTQKLLNQLDLHKPAYSCHRHNEDDRSDMIIRKMLEEDIRVVLTCDAGTPGISDPGHILVDTAWKNGIPVVPVCGPSAVTTAISAAGFDAREFAFYGFLPREKKALGEKLDAILQKGIPVAVLYESPHRVTDLVRMIAVKWKECSLAVCCDLSKYYEKILRGDAETVLTQLSSLANAEKGEYCIVCDLSRVPIPEKKVTELSADKFIICQMMDGLSEQEAAVKAQEQGYKRNEIYKATLSVRRFLEEQSEEQM